MGAGSNLSNPQFTDADCFGSRFYYKGSTELEPACGSGLVFAGSSLAELHRAEPGGAASGSAAYFYAESVIGAYRRSSVHSAGRFGTCLRAEFLG